MATKTWSLCRPPSWRSKNDVVCNFIMGFSCFENHSIFHSQPTGKLFFLLECLPLLSYFKVWCLCIPSIKLPNCEVGVFVMMHLTFNFTISVLPGLLCFCTNLTSLYWIQWLYNSITDILRVGVKNYWPYEGLNFRLWLSSVYGTFALKSTRFFFNWLTQVFTCEEASLYIKIFFRTTFWHLWDGIYPLDVHLKNFLDWVAPYRAKVHPQTRAGIEFHKLQSSITHMLFLTTQTL